MELWVSVPTTTMLSSSTNAVRVFRFQTYKKKRMKQRVSVLEFVRARYYVTVFERKALAPMENMLLLSVCRAFMYV